MPDAENGGIRGDEPKGENPGDDRLREALVLTAEKQRAAAVMAIDLDHYFVVHELLGEADSTGLLNQVEQRLAGVLRPGDVLVRPLADEFVAVLPVLNRDADATGIADRLQRAMAPPFRVGDRSLHLTASIGVALFQRDGCGVNELMRRARLALKDAKSCGRNSVRFHNPGMTGEAARRDELEIDLRQAVARDELELHYQPLVDLSRDGRIHGFEALLRWRHPERGLLLPGEFIGLAEESGLIVPIGEWVLEQACLQGKRWRESFNPELRMAVNLSSRQFALPDLPDTVARLLADADFPARNLELNLQESLLMRDVEQSVATLERLRRMGIVIAMDNFGIGYSSLSYLRRFPLDQIKIDRSFVADLTGRPDDATICTSIIALAHALRLKVVAKGVETETQLGFLMQHGCQAMQGFLFSPALDKDAAHALLAEGRHLHVQTPEAEKPSRRLLMLDDEENVLSSLKRLLRRDGYEIHTATDAARAFELLAAQPFGVVISDQRMPGMNGTEFLRRVKDLYPDTIRIMLSGYTELNAATDAINEGAVYRFLTKPWDDNQLRTTIRDAFNQQELARANNRLAEEARQASTELGKMNEDLHRLLDEKSLRIDRDTQMLGVAQEAVHYVPVPVVGMDCDGMIVLVNETAQALLPGILPGGCRDELPADLADAMATGDGSVAVLLDGREWRCLRRPMGQQSGSHGSLFTLLPPELAGWCLADRSAGRS